MVLVIAYTAGMFHVSIAPNATTPDPTTYTIESHKIVWNLPHHESAMIAPMMQQK